MNLRRNTALGIGTRNAGVTFPLPPDEPMARLRERLAGMVERQDVLRITDLPPGGDGPLTYADAIDLPLITARADSADQVRALLAELRTRQFAHHSGPLWMVVVIDYPDGSGVARRTACAVLDHHVADCISSLLLQDGVCGRGAHPPVTRRGTYQEWVRWQLEQYPMDNPAELATPARDFWRRYFDGGAPNRATALPFCVPDAPLSGLEHVMYRDLPTPTAALHRAAGVLACSPLMLVLASMAAAVGELTSEDDLTMRYLAHGRTPRVVDTLGWFSDYVPLRIRTSSLADPRQALRAAVTAWLALVEHEVTPWGYILGVCGATDAERPQIVVNVLPRIDAAQLLPSPTDTTVPGSRGYLELTVGLAGTGIGRLECRFDPERFAKQGVELLVGLAFERLGWLVAERP
jgi:hypothetical protein